MRSRLCISRNFLTVSAVLKYVWNRVKPARRAVRRRVQEAAEAVTEPFAWHHGDFVKTTPPFSLSFSVSRSRGVYPCPSLLLGNSIYRAQSKYTVFHYAAIAVPCRGIFRRMLKLMSPRFRVSFVGSVSSQRIIAVFCNVNLELEFEFYGNILAVDIRKFASEQTGG